MTKDLALECTTERLAEARRSDRKTNLPEKAKPFFNPLLLPVNYAVVYGLTPELREMLKPFELNLLKANRGPLDTFNLFEAQRQMKRWDIPYQL